MMTFEQWECGEGTTFDEDKKPYDRAGREKVASSAETVIAAVVVGHGDGGA
jgi:hypothetical protein